MRKNTVTSKNRPPQNLTRFPKSRSKYTQTWHHVLKRPPPCINQIKYLHSQQPFYCSSWVEALFPSKRISHGCAMQGHHSRVIGKASNCTCRMSSRTPGGTSCRT